MNNIDILKGLKGAGCDTQGAMERMMGDSDFYIQMLNMFFDNLHLDELESFLSNGNIAGAFDIAHDIKGVSGNLGLSGVFAVASQLTEILRVKSLLNTPELFDSLKVEVDKVYHVVKQA